MSSPIHIALNKTKLLLTSIGAGIFVVLGIWLITNTPSTSIVMVNDPRFIKFIGVLSALFFGFIFVWALRRVFDDKPALIIDDEGMEDNSSGVSAGRVLWKDVTEIKTIKVYNQKFLMLMVRNPKEYIDRQTKKMKKKAMEMNFNSYGSPISITTNSLKYSFNDLKQLIEQKVAASKR